MIARRARETAQAALAMRHQRGRALVGRDLVVFARLQSLGLLARSGLADALRVPGSAADLADRAGLTDVDLTEASLDLAVACGHVRRSGSLYRLKGARARAVASGAAPDVTGLAEEAGAYDSPIYAALVEHLRGEPARDYLAGVGDVIARASRMVEPVVGPWLTALAADLQPASALDVGCGSGVNLRWLARGAPHGTRLEGIDLDAGAIADATANLRTWDLTDRVRVERADLRAMPPDRLGPWDLVLLANNLYYWPVDERSDVLRRIRELTAGAGTVVALSATPGRSVIGRQLDLVMRVTVGCWRLPTSTELRRHAEEAGFSSVVVHDLLPGTGLVALIARG